jgi:hypothetical protein
MLPQCVLHTSRQRNAIEILAINLKFITESGQCRSRGNLDSAVRARCSFLSCLFALRDHEVQEEGKHIIARDT